MTPKRFMRWWATVFVPTGRSSVHAYTVNEFKTQSEALEFCRDVECAFAGPWLVTPALDLEDLVDTLAYQTDRFFWPAETA